MNVSAPGSAAVTVKRLYYTNKAIAGTAINEQVKVGYIVCMDTANAAPGYSAADSLGICVNKCESGNTNLFMGVVTSVAGLPTTSGGVVNGDAGWIEVAAAGDAVTTWTHANMAKNTTGLSVSSGQWYCVATSTSIDTPAESYPQIGIALETHDSSTTSANKKVRITGPD